MATSALIVLDDESFRTRVLGLDWLEFTLLRLGTLGIGHVVVVVDRVPRTLGEILDRVRRAGVACTVARAAGDLTKLFHPDEIVVLVGGTVLADAALVTGVARCATETILCVGDGASAFERIDATSWWTGWATLRGSRMAGLEGAPDGWSAASTLLRSAVQAGVERVSVAPSALFDAASPAGLRAFEARSTMHPPMRQPGRTEGWGARILVEPLARLVTRVVASRLAPAHAVASALAVVLSLAAVVVALFSLPFAGPIAAGLVIVSCVALAVARVATDVTGVTFVIDHPVRLATRGAAVAALVALALPRGGSTTPLVLALAVVALTWLCHRAGRLLTIPVWWADLAGHALLIAVATGIAPALLAPALGIAAVHLLVCLWWWQDKVSQLLTTPR